MTVRLNQLTFKLSKTLVHLWQASSKLNSKSTLWSSAIDSTPRSSEAEMELQQSGNRMESSSSSTFSNLILSGMAARNCSARLRTLWSWSSQPGIWRHYKIWMTYQIPNLCYSQHFAHWTPRPRHYWLPQHQWKGIQDYHLRPILNQKLLFIVYFPWKLYTHTCCISSGHLACIGILLKTETDAFLKSSWWKRQTAIVPKFRKTNFSVAVGINLIYVLLFYW